MHGILVLLKSFIDIHDKRKKNSTNFVKDVTCQKQIGRYPSADSLILFEKKNNIERSRAGERRDKGEERCNGEVKY